MKWSLLVLLLVYGVNVSTQEKRIPLTIAGFADINVSENGWSSAGVVPAIELALEDVNKREDILQGYYLKWSLLDSEEKRIPLTIAGFADINVSENGWSSAGVVPAIELALEDVNKREDILQGYYLKWSLLDSECNPGLAVKLLFQHIRNDPPKLMILGGGCSPATEPVAEAAKYFSLIQVGYSPASASLSNPARFRNFFRTCPEATSRNPSLVTLLNYYKWHKVATITEYVPNLSLSTTNLHAVLRKNNITLLLAETVTQDQSPSIPLDNIEERDAKIIIFNGYEGAARRVFCEVYKKKMYGPHYQWLIPGFYSAGWLDDEDAGTSCTVSEIKMAINKALNIKHLPYDTSGYPTISGMTYKEYEARYRKRAQERGYPENDFHTYGYDAVWAIALALNDSIPKLQTLYTHWEGDDVKGPLKLEEFNYANYYAYIFYHAMNSTSFHGVSGHVRFDQYGDRNGFATQVYQFQDGMDVPVGIYLFGELNIYERSPPKWHGVGPPSDSLLRVLTRVQINPTLYRSVFALSVVGVLLGVGFLVFNITHMNYRHIKMSSPRLNNLIVLGCILGYASAAVFGLDSRLVPAEHLHYVCSASSGLLLLAFTCAFGAMFAKTWRVHVIFTSRIISLKVLKDVHLITFVMVLVLIDLVVLLLWNFVDPTTTSVKIIRVQETNVSLLIKEVELCTSQHQFYWVGAIYVEKGLMLIFGLFLAYETKHVHVPGLNDSRYIGMCVYNVVVMCVVGVTINLAMADQKDVVFAFTSACIIFCSTVTLCLLFIPKIRRLHLDKMDKVCNTESGQEVDQTRNKRLFSSTFHYTLEQITKLRHSFTRNSRVSEMTEVPPDFRSSTETDLAEKLLQKERELVTMTRRVEELEIYLARLNQQGRRKSRDSLFHTLATTSILRSGEKAEQSTIPKFEPQMLY